MIGILIVAVLAAMPLHQTEAFIFPLTALEKYKMENLQRICKLLCNDRHSFPLDLLMESRMFCGICNSLGQTTTTSPSNQNQQTEPATTKPMQMSESGSNAGTTSSGTRATTTEGTTSASTAGTTAASTAGTTPSSTAGTTPSSTAGTTPSSTAGTTSSGSESSTKSS